MRLPENHIYVSHEKAADRIEELEEALGALWWGVGENGAPDELLEKTKDALKGTKYE
jgi:hypothetical protein